MIRNTSTPSHDGTVSSAACVLQVIRRALPGDTGQRKLRFSDCLQDLGISSLRLLSMIMDLEERFDLSAEALARFSTRSMIGTVVQLCLKAATAQEDETTIH